MFRNSQGQQVIIPDLLTNSNYSFLVQLATEYQCSLTTLSREIDFAFASGKKCNPRIVGVIPALTELSVATLETNMGRTHSVVNSKTGVSIKTEAIALTVDDMLTMFDTIGILPLVNPKTFRSAWRNVVTKNRDDLNRQIGLVVMDVLTGYKVKSLTIPSRTGRPRIGYYLSTR